MCGTCLKIAKLLSEVRTSLTLSLTQFHFLVYLKVQRRWKYTLFPFRCPLVCEYHACDVTFLEITQNQTQ